MSRIRGRRRVVAVSAAAVGVLGLTAVVAGPLAAAPKTAKKPVAYITTKSGKCKTGYEKATLHSGKGKKEVTVYTCVLKVTKTVTVTKTKTVTKTVYASGPYQAANSTLVGSGSNTAYGVVASLDTIFNGLQGCDPIASSSGVQPLDFSCPAGSLTGIAAGDSTSENPLNDVAVEEPAIGGSTGVQQLEYQGSHLSSYSAGKVALIGFATTTSGPSATNDEGLNYVAFAEDGLSWFHFTSDKGVPTPSAAVTNLTKADLQGIWSGSITNWDQVGGADATIDVYTASAGAGVRSVWEKYLGESSGGSSTFIESLGSTYADSHIIPQNEDTDIIANGDEDNAIFFFSAGRFSVECGSDGDDAACTGGQTGTTVALGQDDGVAPTAANIYSKAFQPTLNLYTVYSNGSNSDITAATNATLNYASEDGFLCKPDTDVTDPTTGETVRQEIDTAILTNGFLPLDQSTLGTDGVADESAAIAPFAEDTGVTTPADISSSSTYAPFDLSGSTPMGYCKVSSTDGVSTTP